jgi:FAD/FMN-containing dehydrogenase
MRPSAGTALLDELRGIVGERNVLTDPDVVAGYTVDWTGRFRGATPAVVRPHDVEQVAAALRACTRAEVAVVPQGGNTGLVGGSVPLRGEIVCSLRALDDLGPVDDGAAQVTAGAGVTLGRLRAHAHAAGWEYGVDLAARDSATVGGMVATNAGGVHVLRYGATRRQVVGLQAVFADGSVIDRLDGLEKDNTGYDLAGLLCGSEGTLAIVTAARLRLVPRPRHVVVALLAFDTLADTTAAVGTLRRGVDALSALEFFEHAGVELLHEQLHLSPPFTSPHALYLLVEAAGSTDPADALAAAVGALAGLADSAFASDPAASAQLWRYREAHTEAINQLGPPHKLDVTLPAGALENFLSDVGPTVRAIAPSARVWLFGHAGDGNVHVNVTGIDPDDELVTDAVLRLVAGFGGSISAEHGIGVAKRRWLSLTRDEAELRAFRAIKRALDPHQILNPNAILGHFA